MVLKSGIRTGWFFRFRFVLGFSERLAGLVKFQSRFVVGLRPRDDLDGFLLPADRVVEAAGLRVSCGERVEVTRGRVFGKFAGACRIAERGRAVAELGEGAGRAQPGEVIERRGVLGIDFVGRLVIGERRVEVAELIVKGRAEIEGGVGRWVVLDCRGDVGERRREVFPPPVRERSGSRPRYPASGGSLR